MTEGYFFTPNKMIPLNDRPDGEIAQVAKDQLLRFRIVARTWPLYRHYRDERHCMICRLCEQCIYFLLDKQGRAFEYAEEEKLALITAHVRQIHADRVSENGELIDEDAGEREILDSPSEPYSVGFGNGNAYRPNYQGGDSRGIEFT